MLRLASASAALSRSSPSSSSSSRRLLNYLELRRGLAADAAGGVVTRSPPAEKAPLRQRMAWFTAGLATTLGLGLYQVGADATSAVAKLETELKSLRDETVRTQTVLRGRIAKLEAQLGKKLADAELAPASAAKQSVAAAALTATTTDEEQQQ